MLIPPQACEAVPEGQACPLLALRTKVRITRLVRKNAAIAACPEGSGTFGDSRSLAQTLPSACRLDTHVDASYGFKVIF
jgi:hypothetical protein